MKARFAFLFFILFSPLSALASIDWGWQFNPYVGVDGAWRNLNWAPGYGQGHFDKNYQNGSGYLGLQLNRFLAVEAGYQRTNKAQTQKFYAGDVAADEIDPVLGFVPEEGLNARGSALYISEAEMRGAHFTVLGLWPFSDHTTAYALVGAAWNKFYVNTVPIRDSNLGGLGPGQTAQQVIHWSSQRKMVARLGLGLKQMMSSNIAGRIFVIWEDTAHLSGSTPGNDAANGNIQNVNPSLLTDYYTARSKSSTLVGVGLAYYFKPK